jgi:hypothetical protein
MECQLYFPYREFTCWVPRHHMAPSRVPALLTVAVFVCLLTTQSRANTPKMALLTTVQGLTFVSGASSFRQRSGYAHQLSCRGSYCAEAGISSVQCYNMGTDDLGDVLWRCETRANDGFELATTEVICEGFTHPEDPYITAGSCALEYTIKKVDQKPIRQQPPPPPPVHVFHQPTAALHTDNGSDWLIYGSVVAVVGIVTWGIVTCLRMERDAAKSRRDTPQSFPLTPQPADVPTEHTTSTTKVYVGTATYPAAPVNPYRYDPVGANISSWTSGYTAGVRSQPPPSPIIVNTPAAPAPAPVPSTSPFTSSAQHKSVSFGRTKRV